MAKDCEVCHGEGIVYTDLMDNDTHSLCHACNKEDDFEMIEDDMPTFVKVYRDFQKVIKEDNKERAPKDLFEFLEELLEWAHGDE